MFVLNVSARLIGAGIGLTKEYNAHRKSRQAAVEKDGHPHEQSNASDREYIDSESEENEAVWAQAVDAVQQESQPHDVSPGGEMSEEELLAAFVKRHPPPPCTQQQPSGRLRLPVILPERRPHTRTRGWVRGYAPVLADAGVDQAAWFDFLDGFEKSINKNYVFWAANLAVWTTDKVYIASTGNFWVMPIVLATHLAIESGRRGYIHNKHNKWLDTTNEQYFKPRGLYALVVRYKPNDHNELGGYVDIRQNVTESITRRDDPNRPGWKNIIDKAADTVGSDPQIPEFAPLMFPFFNNQDEGQNQSAWKHFVGFLQEYQDRGATAEFRARNPESRLGNAAPQKEYVSRFSNPTHPARQGLVGLVTGGKVNPQRRMGRGRGEGRRHGGGATSHGAGVDHPSGPADAMGKPQATNVASDGVDRNAVSWQAARAPRRRGLMQQDVLYLMVVNMPSDEEMARARQKLGFAADG